MFKESVEGQGEKDEAGRRLGELYLEVAFETVLLSVSKTDEELIR